MGNTEEKKTLCLFSETKEMLSEYIQSGITEVW